MYSTFVSARDWLPGMSSPVDKGVAPEEQIIGPHVNGARLVRAAIGALSSRGAAQKLTDRGYTLNHTTINNMRNGSAVESDSVIKFALGFRIDTNELLKAFGHHPTTTSSENKQSASEEIEYIVNLDELTPEGYDDYDDLPPQVRELAKADATEAAKAQYERSLKNAKSIADAIREVRRDSPGTVGGAGPVGKD